MKQHTLSDQNTPVSQCSLGAPLATPAVPSSALPLVPITAHTTDGMFLKGRRQLKGRWASSLDENTRFRVLRQCNDTPPPPGLFRVSEVGVGRQLREKRGFTVQHIVAWLPRVPLTAPPPMGTQREISLLPARGLPFMEML